MTEKEYDAAMLTLDDDYRAKRKALIRAYGEATALYAIGDVVWDRQCRICIETIEVSSVGRYPLVVYRGRRLKKDGTPTKREVFDYIYQSSVKGAIKKETEG